MACSCGSFHTITLSDDGDVYSFGKNNFGQLGLGHTESVPLPSLIPNLPQIKQVACGFDFTICVDFEGFIWSFGQNTAGQLGTGNTEHFSIPQKISNIPPVQFVACGTSHTLIITNDKNLWSCGNNIEGQLCLGNRENQSEFQLTRFSNVIKASCGNHHSLFQNEEGEIYSCGFNNNGELGLGNFRCQLTGTLIPNLPPNIIDFVCGFQHNLLLDGDGKVFSFGNNRNGQLGLGHTIKQNVLNQIENIPPIRIISGIGLSSYLIDMEGNLWSFGNNIFGELGHGDRNSRNVPTKIENLKDIQQISYGCYGSTVLIKDSQNRIFITGNKDFGYLGMENTETLSTFTEINSQYSTIWRDEIKRRGKSARK